MKYLKLFEQYLNEIGDLSAGNYPVTGPLFDAGGRRYCKYIFKTDSGLEYTGTKFSKDFPVRTRLK